MTEPRQPLLQVEAVGDVTIAQVVERSIVDGASLQALMEELDRLVDSGGCRTLLLDFAGVEFLTSAALLQLVRLNQKLVRVKGRLQIVNVQDPIYELFLVTKLTNYFRVRRGTDRGDEDGEVGGVGSRLIPPRPSDSPGVALPSPPPEPE